MRIFSTSAHGAFDYFFGILLIGAPWLLSFARNEAETWVPVVVGVGVIVYSLMTKYELGVSAVVPIRTHLKLDIFAGGVLALSPWIFGFDSFVYKPHLVLGILEIAASVFTNFKSEPGKHQEYPDNLHQPAR